MDDSFKLSTRVFYTTQVVSAECSSTVLIKLVVHIPFGETTMESMVVWFTILENVLPGWLVCFLSGKTNSKSFKPQKSKDASPASKSVDPRG